MTEPETLKKSLFAKRTDEKVSIRWRIDSWGRRVPWGSMINRTCATDASVSLDHTSTVSSTQVLWSPGAYKQEAYLVDMQVLLTQTGRWPECCLQEPLDKSNYICAVPHLVIDDLNSFLHHQTKWSRALHVVTQTFSFYMFSNIRIKYT